MVDAVGSLARARWVDICLTHDESYLVSNKIDLLIGPSRDTVNHVAMIDSIKVYGKSKEKFNWQDDECNKIKKKQKDMSVNTNKNEATAINSAIIIIIMKQIIQENLNPLRMNQKLIS